MPKKPNIDLIENSWRSAYRHAMTRPTNGALIDLAYWSKIAREHLGKDKLMRLWRDEKMIAHIEKGEND